MNLESLSDKKKLMWAIYSFVALSNWSYYLVCNVIGFRFFVYEPFFIPLLISFLLHGRKTFKVTKNELIVAVTIVVCFMCGVISNPEYFVDELTTFRTIVYFLVIVPIFSHTDKIDINFIKKISLFTVIGDLIYCLTINVTSDTSSINLGALMLLVIIPILECNIVESIIFSMIGLIVAFRSTFRVSIFVVFLAIVLSVLYVFFVRKKRKAFMLAVILAIGVIFIIFKFDTLVSFVGDVLNMNPYSLYRVSVRLKALLNFDFVASQDQVRQITISRVFTEFPERIIPRGLVGKAIGEYGWYKDSPVLFLYDAFGSIISWAFIFYFMQNLVKCIKKSMMYRKKVYLGMLSISGTIYVILLFLNGTFLLNTYEVCFSAMILGLLSNHRVECLREIGE